MTKESQRGKQQRSRRFGWLWSCIGGNDASTATMRFKAFKEREALCTKALQVYLGHETKQLSSRMQDDVKKIVAQRALLDATVKDDMEALEILAAGPRSKATYKEADRLCLNIDRASQPFFCSAMYDPSVPHKDYMENYLAGASYVAGGSLDPMVSALIPFHLCGLDHYFKNQEGGDAVKDAINDLREHQYSLFSASLSYKHKARELEKQCKPNQEEP